MCGAPAGRPSVAAAVGITRGEEAIRAMRRLGLEWSEDPASSDILLLGYPNLGLTAVAAAREPFTGDPSRLHHTYAVGDEATPCEGDLRFRLDRRHSDLTAVALAADVDAVVALARPVDVYTHVTFDGHPDHAEVARQVESALARSGLSGRLHRMLIHPEGTGRCMALSADRWPNPPLGDADPYARFTPSLDVTAPPLPPCADAVTGAGWGPEGEPDELVEVPQPMQANDPAANLKWQVIATYASQIDCQRDGNGRIHASCGYMRAFVKRHEFFWTRPFGRAPAPRDGSVLVVAAHPDDEALGAAGVIAHARAAGRRVRVAVVTNGDTPLR